MSGAIYSAKKKMEKHAMSAPAPKKDPKNTMVANAKLESGHKIDEHSEHTMMKHSKLIDLKGTAPRYNSAHNFGDIHGK